MKLDFTSSCSVMVNQLSRVGLFSHPIMKVYRFHAKNKNHIPSFLLIFVIDNRLLSFRNLLRWQFLLTSLYQWINWLEDTSNCWYIQHQRLWVTLNHFCWKSKQCSRGWECFLQLSLEKFQQMTKIYQVCAGRVGGNEKLSFSTSFFTVWEIRILK